MKTWKSFSQSVNTELKHNPEKFVFSNERIKCSTKQEKQTASKLPRKLEHLEDTSIHNSMKNIRRHSAM